MFLLMKKCIYLLVLVQVEEVQVLNSVPETKIADFANSVDLDEVATHEPPHQDLHCLSSSL